MHVLVIVFSLMGNRFCCKNNYKKVIGIGLYCSAKIGTGVEALNGRGSRGD